MKKITRRSFLSICGAAAAAAALTACGGAASSTAASSAAASSTAASASSTAALSGNVATGGSTSMKNVIAALTEGFAEIEPDVTISYDPTGSGAGITGATDKTLDIGLSSRALKADETGVTGTIVALDGIAIIVNKDSKVEDLTVDQLKQMFTGEITNWSEVGGDDGEIVLVGREAGSGTRDGFESIVDVKDSCKYAQELTATGAVISAVEANPLAIGYASLSAVGDTVKAVTVGGVECSEETVKDGSYVLSRPFNIVTKGDATDPVAVDFIAYVLSKDGQAIATDNGYIGEDGADFTSAQPAGKIVVGGSSSVSPLMEKLIEAYKTVNPNAELELQTTDSTTGVSGALEGTYTIGMASRELKDSEVEGGAKATVLALDGIAVVVNPSNTTDDLTVDQIKGIYTGELTTWADVQ